MHDCQQVAEEGYTISPAPSWVSQNSNSKSLALTGRELASQQKHCPPFIPLFTFACISIFYCHLSLGSPSAKPSSATSMFKHHHPWQNTPQAPADAPHMWVFQAFSPFTLKPFPPPSSRYQRQPPSETRNTFRASCKWPVSLSGHTSQIC